jgi:anti-sigma regulatory factor (Ser/Thr protein kinase)
MSHSSADPQFVPSTEDPARFSRHGVGAHAVGAAQTRVAFGLWLQRHFALSAERLSDVVLAVNEALANAAEFAHTDCADPDTMDLLAHYDSHADTLTVAVVDHGRWREPAPDQPEPGPLCPRGRGIPLMRALADEATIEPVATGTQVRLVWGALSRTGAQEHP